MKIGYVFDDSLDKTDGVQQYMLTLASWFTSQGHEVHYLVGETKRTDIPLIHSLSRNVRVQFNGNRMSIPLGGSKRRIGALLAKEQFDVLHVQVPYHPLLAGRIIRAANSATRVVGTFHIVPYSKLASRATRLLGMWSYTSLRRFDAMVSVSPAAADAARRAFHINSQVIPNAFDYQRFADAKPMSRYAAASTTIVFLGRLVPRKGCQALLEAIASLPPEQKTGLQVVICGNGPLRSRLQRYVEQHGLQAIISFVGRISEADKPRYLASADIAVFPSSGGESFGIVLLEAMASGRAAVLGGDNPGYRSVLGSRPQQLFATHDAFALRDLITTLIADPLQRQAAADWGREWSQQYDVAVVGRQLLELYKPVA